MTHDQHPAIRQIDADIATITSAKQAAEGERDRTALAVRVGTDKKAASKLDALTAELASYSQQLDTLAGARRAAVEAAAANHHGARKELLAANVADALSASRVRVESAVKLERAIADLGKALESHNAHGLLAWSALSKSSELVGGIENVLPLHDSALGNGAMESARQALAFAVARANDLGGARLHLEYPGLATVHGSIIDGARADALRLERAVAGFVATDANATPAPVAPAVIDRVPRTAVINGTTQIVGMEGSQYV